VTTALRFDWFHYNSTDAYSGAYLFRLKLNTQNPKTIPKTPKIRRCNILFLRSPLQTISGSLLGLELCIH
jgi:hypothetical protein